MILVTILTILRRARKLERTMTSGTLVMNFKSQKLLSKSQSLYLLLKQIPYLPIPL
jgi:hypothetical protein